jgi:hypothetical protein
MSTEADSPPLRRSVALRWEPAQRAAGLRRALAAAAAAGLVGLGFGLFGQAARPEVGLGLLLLAAALTLRPRADAAVGAGLAALIGALAGIGTTGSWARGALLGALSMEANLPGWSWWAAGAALGAAAAARSRAGAGAEGRAAAGLGAGLGAAGAGIGVGVGALLNAPAATWAVSGLGLGLGLGLSALVGAAKPHERVRLPSAAAVERALGHGLAPPVHRAAALDAIIAETSPDAPTREGLAEVAVWVLRLQWLRRALARELGAIDPEELRGRLARIGEEAAAADDPFLSERKAASAEHLRRLLSHHAELGAEDRRTAALVEYALAFLEEARGSLALARVQPGDQTPAQLADVLGRLRAHQTDQRAQREAARELGAQA